MASNKAAWLTNWGINAFGAVSLSILNDLPNYGKKHAITQLIHFQ
jgi:hypothetical protein